MINYFPTCQHDFLVELQALAVDWMTGNIYMVFRFHRRIYTCAHETTSCVELLGNQVSEDVTGLALHPTRG